MTLTFSRGLFLLLICVIASGRVHARAASSSLPAADWQISAGLGLLIGPRYPGAATVRALPIPAFDARNGAVFFNGREGLGVDLLEIEDLRGGAAMFFRSGRKESDDRLRLAGLADIDVVPQARLFAVQSWRAIQVRAVVGRDLGGGDGTTLDLDASLTIRLGDRIRLSAGPQAAFGDGRFMRTYFGIAPGRARPAYGMNAGLYQAGMGAGLFTRVGQRWAMGGSVSANWLQGPAARSPVVGARAQISGGLFLTYAFKTGDPGNGRPRYGQ
ncbi:MAG: MipA/OmpV family protein [Rhodospirillaceae bacterium]|nr:MipA/OmpV family protein [Rhodospirillaceae bacterium]